MCCSVSIWDDTTQGAFHTCRADTATGEPLSSTTISSISLAATGESTAIPPLIPAGTRISQYHPTSRNVSDRERYLKQSQICYSNCSAYAPPAPEMTPSCRERTAKRGQPDYPASNCSQFIVGTENQEFLKKWIISHNETCWSPKIYNSRSFNDGKFAVWRKDWKMEIQCPCTLNFQISCQISSRITPWTTSWNLQIRKHSWTLNRKPRLYYLYYHGVDDRIQGQGSETVPSLELVFSVIEVILESGRYSENWTISASTLSFWPLQLDAWFACRLWIDWKIQ